MQYYIHLGRGSSISAMRMMVAVVAITMIAALSTTVSAAPTTGIERETETGDDNNNNIINNNNNAFFSASSSLLLSCDSNSNSISSIADAEEQQREEFEIEEIQTAPSESPSGAPPCSDPYSNARGVYTSAMAPCIITFHKNAEDDNSSNNNNIDDNNNNNNNNNLYYHGTSNVCEPGNGIGELKEYVTMWPDECVGDFARCYDLKDHRSLLCPSLLRLLLSSSTSTSTLATASLGFPVGTTHVSVDCTADKDVVAQNYERSESLKHDNLRDVVSAKNETTLFAVVSVLSSVLIVVYAISQLVVKPIVSAITRNHDHAVGSNGGTDGSSGREQEQEDVALVMVTTNLRLDDEEGGGDAAEEDEDDENSNINIIGEEEGVPGDENDTNDDEQQQNQQQQHGHHHHYNYDYNYNYEHFDSQIPMDFDAVPIVPAIIIPMEAIPATVVQDGIIYHS